MILKGISKNVRFCILDTTNLVKKALNETKANVMYSNQIAKMLSIGAILAEDIKNEKTRLSLNLLNNGVIENIIIKSTLDKKLSMKIKINEEKEKMLYDAISNNEEIKTKELLDLNNASLEIQIDYGLKRPYTSKINVRASLLELALNDYLNQSVQTKSITICSTVYNSNAEIEKSSALLIQNLPNADDRIIEFLAGKLERLTSISNMLKNGFSLEKIAYLLFEDDVKIFENESIYTGLPFDKMPLIEDIKILDKRELEYGCDCNKIYMKEALIRALSKDEIKNMIEEDKKIEIICSFCNKKYTFKDSKEIIYE